MATTCNVCTLREKRCFKPMTPADVRRAGRYKRGEQRFAAGSTILAEGTRSLSLYTVLDGAGLRFKLLPDGRRQVLNFVLPGDFLGLQAAVMGEMCHSVEAVTPITACAFDRADFWEMMRENPEGTHDIVWLAASEEHFLGEMIATVGQRSAEERIAWAAIRLYRRGEALDLARDGRMAFPFRQQDLADALGLSLVHTNKTLARFRERGILDWANGMLLLHKPHEAARIAMVDFDAALPRRPLV